ncbi:MAG TPA: DUF2283 domain-containing protein [Desulfobacterales bacterium]|nr:DUF2283 domain-containing protein [Desulfobacterales bacterium]
MRITYDTEVDALYIRFLETTVTTQHLAEGIAVDYAAGSSKACAAPSPSPSIPASTAHCCESD